jgi:hypothetical protein
MMRVIPMKEWERYKRGLAQVQHAGKRGKLGSVGVLSRIPLDTIPITLSPVRYAGEVLTYLPSYLPTYTLPPYWAMLRRLLCSALPLRA